MSLFASNPCLVSGPCRGHVGFSERKRYSGHGFAAEVEVLGFRVLASTEGPCCDIYTELGAWRYALRV